MSDAFGHQTYIFSLTVIWSKKSFLFSITVRPHPYLHQTTEPQGSYENYTYLDEGPLVHHELQYQCICTLSASCICYGK